MGAVIARVIFDNNPIPSSLTVSVTFPQPFSHLLDVHVIIGDSIKLYKMVAGLEAEIGQSERQSWDKLAWLTKDW